MTLVYEVFVIHLVNLISMKYIKSFLIILLILGGSIQAQEKLYVSYFEVLGMHPDYQVSLTRLFKSYVDIEGRYISVLPLEVPEKQPTTEGLMKLAQDKGCTYFMTGEMNRLAEVVICTFTLYDASTGNKVWNDMLRAMTPDDLDPILKRVARAMGTENKATTSGDIYSVTEYDSRELKQLRANYSFGISVGGAYPFYKDVEKAFGAGYGVMASYDSRNIILDIKGEMYFSDVDMYFLSLDALYPFSPENSTPYLLGGLGIGGINVVFENERNNTYPEYWPSERGGGLLLFLGGGYIINRQSNVNLRLGGRAFMPMFKVGKQTAPGIMFNVSILFGRR